VRASEREVFVERSVLPAALEARQVFRRKQRELPPGPETGDRVVTYLRLGVRNTRDVRRDLGPKIPRVMPYQYRR